jgi:citrate lyase subunit beta / citryl-CoA lyase
VIAPAGPRRGEAGRQGDDVRSDLHVVVEAIGDELDIEIRSSVAALFGEDIRARVQRTLLTLGVERARVRIDDHGAVPWVIAARVEAAARAAGLVTELGEALPHAHCERPRTARDRLRRSRLYLPGGEPKFMLNAALHRPDAVILDLEDSVHPAHKAGARLLVRNAVRAVDFGGTELMVRINQLPLGFEDLEVLVPECPDVLLIPKVERPEQVLEVERRIATIREDRLLKPDAPPIWLMPIIESALGVESAFAIASASPNIVALTIGLEDYTADLGVPRTREGAESLWARQRIVNAARAAGVQPIDSVYGDVQDDDGLRAWGRASRALGFIGMGCVHPRQIRIVHEAFRPALEEIEYAQRVVAAFHDATERGLGVVSLGSRMIDPPVVMRALRLVEEARAAGAGSAEGGAT